jgi:hypothetical protein
MVLAGLVALGGVSATVILAANPATTIRVGDLALHVKGVISPSVLPRNEMAPISVHVRGSVETIDGTHVPPAQTVHLQIDRHFRIESIGLPTCTLGKIVASPPSHAMKVCGSALIGRGHATAQVAFPEQLPFSATGPLLAFNGPPIGGYPEMFFYIYVAVPAPSALVVVAKLSKDHGKYAYEVSQTIPKLAGGSGSLTGFELTLGRRWTYKGKRHSYLNAECPSGHFVDQIEAAFGDGTELSGAVVNTCEPKSSG